ncbi:MAG TPA: hypothetical protein VMH91_02370 [Candidatus Paceibacterota bacterium]|nr:hypothetical protein [Candidatus Paceibacterota bacterium]
MLLLLHILIAVSSIVFATLALAFPSKRTLGASYVLITLTIVTGVYLVIANPAPLLQTCITGITYVLVVSTCAGFATYRYVRASS